MLKKLFPVLIILLIVLENMSMNVFAEQYSRKTSEINIRDPFVLVYDGKYYMYGTGLGGRGYGCVVSEDLENWSSNHQVFKADDSFAGYCDFWAPECHFYDGEFYLFATFRQKSTDKRGVGIFKSTSPLGPFSLISNGPVTPHDTDSIDGTLYVDENNQPWIIYVNEWTSAENEIGTMSCAKLSKDLSEIISSPKLLFKANGHIWTKGKVTDGPFVYRTKTNSLVMLWSNSAKSGGYAVGLAKSDNNLINGNWVHLDKAIYKKDKTTINDGGHGMLFTDLDGNLMMAIHSPNGSGDGYFETAKFIKMVDIGNAVVPENYSSQAGNFFTNFYLQFLSFFSRIFG